MKKPSVYLDTSIISAYWDKGNAAAIVARRQKTVDWWNQERRHFDLWTSAAAESELRLGNFPHQRECMRMVNRVRYLTIDGKVDKLTLELISLRIVPETKPGDAIHMAVATAHEVDYLLTWNYAHLANPVV
jgi:hypothetical protein